MQRIELTPTAARRLFSGTAGHNPTNMLSAMAPQWVTRGGIRF